MSEDRKQELDKRIQEKENRVQQLDMDIQRLSLEFDRKTAELELDKHELLRRAIEVGSNAYVKMPNETLVELTKRAAEKLTAEIEKL